MLTFEEKLQEWIINETNFLAEKNLEDIPDLSKLSILKEGKNRKIWDYILTHVRSKYTVLKIKLILKLKRDQNNPEKLFPKPVKDLTKFRQEIANAEDKQKFLKNSLSNLNKEIFSTEQSLQNIHKEIDKISQKTAILHLITIHYQEKISLLNSLHGRLSLHLTDGIYKHSTKILPSSIDGSAKKSYSVSSDEINPRVKYLVEQTESLVAKKIRNSSGIASLNFNLQKRVNEVFKGSLIYDLLFILKEQSKTSCMNMMKSFSKNRIASVKSSKRDSEKLLQELKFNHININFQVKKVKNDICKLLPEKGSLLMTKMNPFSDDTEYQTKCMLLDKIAENAGLMESIGYLEEILSKEQSKVNISKSMNVIINEDIVNIQNKFYNDFDTMCLLLNSVPSILDDISKRFVDIHKYASEDLFLMLSSVLQEFPDEPENQLKFENESLWNVLKKNDMVKPMLQGSYFSSQPVPDTFWNLVDVAPFQHHLEICRNVKLFKDYISSNKTDYWEYNEQRLTNACQQYDKMINMLQETEEKLSVSEENLDDGLSFRSQIETALQEWWEQSAQFIPDIVYDNKTLKMWIDIVNAADGVV